MTDPAATGNSTPAGVLGLDPSTYQPHPLHDSERIWTETNCYIDVWIEVLHALGRDPIPGLASAFEADFLNDQWIFLKFFAEDLRDLYGLQLDELSIWQPLTDHFGEQLNAGHLVTVETDSWYLPDTEGVAYQIEHQKTTIIPEFMDPVNRRLRYFHNAGYWELSGDDFDGALQIGSADTVLPPYVELVRLGPAPTGQEFTDRAIAAARQHAARRPSDNPVQRLVDRLRADLPWLASHDLPTYHRYAFVMLRQCGFTAELAAALVDWLTAHGAGDFADAASEFRTVAETTKSVQFRLARLPRGRKVDVEQSLATMANSWANAMGVIAAWAG